MDVPIGNHKYFNNKWFARWAKIYYYEKYIMFPIRRKAAKFPKLDGPKHIIDIACGTGSQAVEFAKLGHDVVGIDLSPEMLNQAKRKLRSDLKLHFQQADATELPFTDNTFDVASISFGLHDMPYDVELLTLQEAKRVVKPGGIILIVEYMEPKKSLLAKLCYPIFWSYETKHWRAFQNRGLRSILNDVNLIVSSETSILNLFQIVIAKNGK